MHRAILISLIVIVSCSDEPTALPETGYIRAVIGEKEIIYSTPVDNPIIHKKYDTEFHITFRDAGDPFLSWTITVINIDFDAITFPYTIEGPDESGIQPAFWCNILDSNPANSAYGRYLAGTTNLYWNSRLTLTLVGDDLVMGTFEVEGIDHEQSPIAFRGGRFLARFN